MSEILCITNRKLCKEDFFIRIEKIAAASPSAIILREKDLEPEEYTAVASKVIKICDKYNTKCILHNFYDTAAALKSSAIHLPLPVLSVEKNMNKSSFTEIGSSCHSVEEAEKACSLGCTYITAGHIFATDCKKNLAPRGLKFLNEICNSVPLPVYAIGGITEENCISVIEAGASGICVMSSIMTCSSPEKYISELKKLI